MKRCVYFHIDEVARDAVVASALKAVLAKHGVDVVYGNRLTAGYAFKDGTFDAMVLPAVTFMESMIGNPDVQTSPIIILPTEGIGGIPEHPHRAALKFIGHKFMAGDLRWSKMVSAYCLWGQQQIIGFERFAPDLVERCHVIGHPRFDRRCLGVSNRRATTQLGDDRIKIGVLTRFYLTNPFDSRGNFSMLRRMRKKDYHHLQQEGSDLDVEDLFYTQAMDMRILFDFIDAIDPTRHRVILRVHPRENRQQWLNIIRELNLHIEIADWDKPFIHWVNDVDWIVSPPSTSFYDCLYLGKPVICTDKIISHRRNHVPPISDDTSQIIEYTYRPQSLAEMVSLVDEKPQDKQLIQSETKALLEHDAGYPGCLDSIERLAEVCLTVIKESSKKTTPLRRLEFQALSFQRWLKMRGVYEQGSIFRLDSTRQAWIDGLTDR